MTPYYDEDGVTIYHGDAVEILPTLAAGTVTAVVTDPPYVIGAVSAGNMASKSGGWGDMMNSSYWFTAWYREVDRVLKRRGSFWTFCNWSIRSWAAGRRRSQPVTVACVSSALRPRSDGANSPPCGSRRASCSERTWHDNRTK